VTPEGPRTAAKHSSWPSGASQRGSQPDTSRQPQDDPAIAYRRGSQNVSRLKFRTISPSRYHDMPRRTKGAPNRRSSTNCATANSRPTSHGAQSHTRNDEAKKCATTNASTPRYMRRAHHKADRYARVRRIPSGSRLVTATDVNVWHHRKPPRLARYCEFPVTIGRRASGCTLPCLASRIGCLP